MYVCVVEQKRFFWSRWVFRLTLWGGKEEDEGRGFVSPNTTAATTMAKGNGFDSKLGFAYLCAVCEKKQSQEVTVSLRADQKPQWTTWG